MSFANDADFEDDFRRAGKDATADFELPGDLSNPTEHASSENLDVAAKAADEDELEDDDEPEDDDLEDDDDEDLDDDDLEDDDEDEDGDDLEDDDDLDDDDDDDDDDEDDDEDLEDDDDDTVKARLSDAEKRARAS